jgi:DNA modification methylase
MSRRFLDGKVELHGGDSREVLKTLREASVDSVVCDPPYGLDFMGRAWDSLDGAPFAVEFWAQVLRVLKPGGHLVAFSGTRTYHRLACAIEDAGFEIRDQLAWAYGSGFPKSLDVSKALDKAAGAEREKSPVIRMTRKGDVGEISSNVRCAGCGKPRASANPCTCPRLEDIPATDAARQWSGWGSALKPAWEPIVLARKPLIGTVAQNVTTHGTGALNIDGCRVGVDAADPNHRAPSVAFDGSSGIGYSGGLGGRPNENLSVLGRWPANLLHDGSEEVVSLFPETHARGNIGASIGGGGMYGHGPTTNDFGAGDSGSAARFFYQAKADSHDRLGSRHPTIKPVDLMQWLVRLVTPKNGLCLDPFAGTGTTGEACWREGMRAILIEREEEYQADIARRMELAQQPTKRAAVAKTKNALTNPNDLPLFAMPEAAE